MSTHPHIASAPIHVPYPRTLAHLVVEHDNTACGCRATATFLRRGFGDYPYRYALTRAWGHGSTAVFIMLNPSTADAATDDPTIRRCVAFADSWGCGGLVALNLFALRATNPAALRNHADPVGRDNDPVVDWWLARASVGPVVYGWGAHVSAAPSRVQRVDHIVRSRVARPVCLGVTKGGNPRHPLYVRGDTVLTPAPQFCTPKPAAS